MKIRTYLLFLGSILFISTVHAQSGAEIFLSRIQIYTIEEQLDSIKHKVTTLQTKEPQQTIQILHAGIQLATNLEQKQTVADFNYKKAKLLSKQGLSEKSIASFQQAHEIYLSLNKLDDLCKTGNSLGWVYIKSGDYTKAREQFKETLAYAKKGQIDKQIADNYNDIGVTYHYQKEYKQAIDFYLKATAIREQLALKGLGISYNNLGIIYKLNRDTAKAYEFYQKGKQLAISTKDTARLISFTINIGRLKLDQKKSPQAILAFKEALFLSEKIANNFQIALSQNNLGEAYLFRKEFDISIQYYEKCIQNFDIVGARKNKIGSIYELGRTYSLSGAPQKGLNMMLQAEDMAKQTQMEFSDELGVIAQTYYDLDQPSLAYQYLTKYVSIQDSLESIDVKEYIGRLQTKYEVAFQAKEKDQEIALLNLETDHIKQLLLFSIFFSFLIIGLAILLFLYMRKMKVLNKQLEKAIKIKEEFLASMSHEIRTPMNAVIGMTNILIDEDPSLEQIGNLRTLKFSANNLLTLINDILDFSKIESGKIHLEQIDLSLMSLVNNILATFRLSKTKENVKIYFEGDIDQLKYHLKGDPTRITQIFTNLLGNALKFTDKGYVKLIANIVEQRDDEVNIYCAVEDTGIGIPQDKLEVIFENFTQASNNTTRLYGGTGLGLAITKNLVELHGSKIQLTSKVGSGSTFAFNLTFPIGKPIVKQATSLIENSISIKKGLEGYNILLAEDNKINQLVAKKILSKWKVNLDIANDGLEVLDYLQEKEYDIILMDIQMPNMNGYEATAAIRALNGPKSQTPIIALTASTASTSAIIQGGMNDYVIKPFNPNYLHSCISSLVRKKKAIAEPA